VIDENHRYSVLKTRLVDECLHPAFGKNFFLAKNFSRRSVDRFLFLQDQKFQALNGWTVCRFHGARGGAPGMAITATVPEPRPPSSFGASSNR